MREGEQLRQFIENQRHSKTKIAEKMGITRQALYEMFETVRFTEETKGKIAEALGQNIFGDAPLPRPQVERRQLLEESVHNLTATQMINAKSIDRLVSLLERTFSSETPGISSPSPLALGNNVGDAPTESLLGKRSTPDKQPGSGQKKDK